MAEYFSARVTIRLSLRQPSGHHQKFRRRVQRLVAFALQHLDDAALNFIRPVRRVRFVGLTEKITVKRPFPFVGEWLAGVRAPVPTRRKPSEMVLLCVGYRSYGNELWEFDEIGYMKRRFASINDSPIKEADRRFRWERELMTVSENSGNG